MHAPVHTDARVGFDQIYGTVQFILEIKEHDDHEFPLLFFSEVRCLKPLERYSQVACRLHA
jgi:hypothetical protein